MKRNPPIIMENHLQREIMQLNPYPEYKPATLPWLADVPKHWELIPNWALLQLKKEVVGELSATQTLLSLTKVGIIERDMENPTGKFPTSFDTYQSVEPGDLIFCLFDMDETPRTVGLSTLHGMVTGAYTRFTCRDETLRRFLFLLYLHLDNGKLLKPIYSGLRKVISTNTFLTTKSPVPPKSEQAAIVCFFDHADEQIRRYVAAKERLIALLEEQRQALVHQAVTRGLDHNVRLKPSGVEWVGDVPEHWETVRLGSIGRFSKGNGGTKEDEVPAGVPCIRYGDIYTSHKYFINASRAYIKPEKTSEYTPLRFGDILFAGSGETIEEIGKSAVNLIDGPAYSGGDVIIFRPTIRLNAEFTGYATDAPTTQAQKSIMGRGFTVMHIYGNQLKNIQIALPPIGEQDGIVEHINNGTALIDDTIARSHRQINLMNEYRTRLIADVVTGQLDVREAAAKLPAESLENKLPNEVVPA